MIGFVFARLGYLNIDVGFRAGAAPGEYYWLKQKVYRGILSSPIPDENLGLVADLSNLIVGFQLA